MLPSSAWLIGCFALVALAGDEPGDLASRARELHEANPAQQHLPPDVQLPALQAALELRERARTIPAEPLAEHWPLANLRDLLLLWTQWYGIERDHWLLSDASAQHFVVELRPDAGADATAAADMLRAVGGCDVYVLEGGSVLAFARGAVADVDLHEDLLATLCATAGGEFVAVSALEARDAADPSPSLLWLRGRVEGRRFAVDRAGTAGTRLRPDRLGAALSMYQDHLRFYEAAKDEETGRIVTDLASAEAARSLAARLREVTIRTPPTWCRGRRLHTYCWETHVALIASYDAFAGGRPLFPPSPLRVEDAERRRAARDLPVPFWATGRARTRTARWLALNLLAAALATAVLLRRRRRTPRAP